MAFIKCPECGQTALSIASVCPKCGHLLMQTTPPQGGGDQLVQCPRCSKFIDRAANRCEYCGFPRLFWRRTRWAGLAVLGLVAVVGGGVGIGSLMQSRPAARDAQPVAPVRTAPAPPVREDTALVTAAPIVVDTPHAVTADSTLPPGAPPGDTVPTSDRWVITWANLREGPGLDFPVIRILLPGTRVRVAAPARGFSAVYGPAGREGYVAVSLLSDHELPRDSLAGALPP